MKSVDKYNYYKDKYPYSIIFVREGNFYKTYNNDAYIIWDLFHYKWLNNSIAFGTHASDKVFNDLRNKSIGYLIINENEINIKGNNESYDLYLKIANINYDKYNKINRLKERIETIINNDIDNYHVINNLFDKIESVDNEELIK